ncbi:MAG: alpha/beta fold hydrolase, partial [Pseudomonadota bacterium]
PRTTAEGPVIAAARDSLPTADGGAVPVARWDARAPAPEAGPRLVLLALHGYGDYGLSTYAGPGPAWAAAGITVYAPDQRGFGRGPTRGAWPGADALVADAIAFAETLRARHPGVPLALLGHSMGGGVALAAAPAVQPDALVLVAPAIWGGATLNPMQRIAAWLAAATVPDRRFTGDGLVEIQASDNIEALRALGQDPAYLGAPSAREILGLVRVLDRAAAAADRAEGPALLLLGARDEIVPAGRARARFARVEGPRRTVEYAEGWHLLFRDCQAPRVWADVAAWLLANATPGAPVDGAGGVGPTTLCPGEDG